jgi:hypothetical protein
MTDQPLVYLDEENGDSYDGLPLHTPAGAPSLPEFDESFGESFAHTVDLSTWRPGEDLIAAYGRLEQEVAEALAREDDYSRHIRADVFPEIAHAPGAPPCAGVYAADPAHIQQVHSGLLFNGGVEACDGISVVHETLPLTITQIGVCLVAYNGRQGAWAHRLFRRDLRSRVANPVDEVLGMLERRKRNSDGRDQLSNLARRGIMAYAERALLRDNSTATWRMGHGSVLPFELVSGLWASTLGNLRQSLELLEWYVHYGRFVFVPHRTQKRHLLMIGNALRPREYALVHTLQPDIRNLIDRGHYRDENGVRPAMERLANDVAPRIVVGVFRVWDGAPPYIFYASAEEAHMAAHVAIADAMLQEHRGFPMLIDLADTVCRTTFGVDSLVPTVQTAYARSGDPLRPLSGRDFGV